MKYVAALALLGLVGTGCTVDVRLGTQGAICFTEESDGGLPVAHREGEEFVEGCTKCTCQPDGQMLCEQVDCPQPCAYDDTMVALGASVPAHDGCNTCTCTDGVLTCTDKTCGCDIGASPPGCVPSSPFCTSELVCENETWTCREDCPCGDAMPPACPQAPTGCGWTGPYCDGVSWSCGDLICDGCLSMPGMCDDPMMPGCYADVWCDGFAWQCIVSCDTCPDAPPQCFSRNADIGCTSEPYCDPMYGWTCDETCPSPGCNEPPPVCDYMGPACYGQPLCIDEMWYCEFVCM